MTPSWVTHRPVDRRLRTNLFRDPLGPAPPPHSLQALSRARNQEEEGGAPYPVVKTSHAPVLSSFGYGFQIKAQKPNISSFNVSTNEQGLRAFVF